MRAQPPSLPTGGGAVRGIGEKFSTSAPTGTGSLTIPIAMPGARGFTPSLALHYDSGAGNGPFGAGWRLSVPHIARKTDKQLPTYNDADAADVFVLSGAEDLVPVPGGTGDVRWYRPRVEAGFARIERHGSGRAAYWITITADNVRSTYGRSEAARVADPRDPTRIFSWLLERTEDSLGNVAVYEYVPEDFENVAATPAEQHRLDGLAPITNTYLSTVRYGKLPGAPERFAFSAVLDYGDREGVWPARLDAFSSYRPGFEVRTYRRCQRVLVFHDLPELGPSPRLVRSLELVYDDDPALAHLVAVEQRAYDDAGTMLAVPALRLRYTQAIANDEVRQIVTDAGDLPAGIEVPRHQWVDLDAEGIPGVISDGDGALYFRRNLGGGALGPARPLSLVPAIAAPAARGRQLIDVDGDGRLELVSFGPPLPGYHARIPAGAGDGDWEVFQAFTSRPQIAWTDPNVRFLDLDGDGIDDVLVTKDDTFVWYPSLGKDGFGPPRVLPRPSDEEHGPAIVFADTRRAIVLADLSGDGLRDLVRVENGSICYWPNLGHGKFGAKVTMARAPVFDHPDQFEAKRVLFADIDGTGTSDVLYAGRDGVRYWLNQAGNTWSDPHDVAGVPPDHAAAHVTAVDLLGTGTACLAWTSSAPGDAAIRYVDLVGGVKPHLLAELDNQLGLTTRVAYAPSTKFYLADRAAGIHWSTQLPFVVHVVERVEVDDAVRKVRFVSEYRYRDGYFDGYEREFRGFGYVEQRDTESDPAQLGIGLFADRPPPVNGEYSQPPVVTKTWFHTGGWLDRGNGAPIVIKDVLSPTESRDAYRALRGAVLRQEICAEDGPLAALPYLVTLHGYEVSRLYPGVFFAHPRETIETHSERALSDARIRHELVIETDDLGHVRRQVAIGYRSSAPDARPEQQTLRAVLTESDVVNVTDREDWYRHGVPREIRTYELGGLPNVDAPLSFEAVKAVADTAVELTYDQPVADDPAKRLVARQRTRYYDSNAIPTALPFGQIDERALAFGSFGLVFTPTLLATLYGDRVTDAILTEGGYQQLDDDPGNWWVPSGRSVPDPSRFFLPTSYVDPFGKLTTVAYDAHCLAITSVTDAVHNTTSAEIDYRVMGPAIITDANGCRSRATFDALGRVTAIWLTGANGEGDPFTGEPTSKFDYAFYDPTAKRPSCAHGQARETHALATTRWQHSYAYADGAGQVVMKKVQAEPGPAKQLQADGTCIDVAANPRWIGTGRTVFDNKGNPIKQYEPYFSVTSDYEDEDALVCQGVTPLLHYDALGRLIATENPDGSTSRVAMSPWQQESWDGNDTILDQGNVWYARARAGTPAQQRAATVTEPHARTSTLTLFDTLGRAFAVIANNGGGDLHETRTTLDIEGNPLVVTDALGRACLTRAFSMLGQACYQSSIDAGERWAFVDVTGQQLRRWDRAGLIVSSVYDDLRRPIEVHVQAPSGSKLLAEKTVWGEQAPASVAYPRGRVYQHFDGAGVVTIEGYEFKGSVAASTRQLATHYDVSPDWAGSPDLDAEVFRIATEYDALARPTQVTTPDHSVMWPSYNASGLLDKVEIQLRGAQERTTFVASIDYDEKGQRTSIVYGSAATTSYKYEPLTFRLSTLQTTRTSDGRALQDLSYAYDPVGNVVQIGDAVQQPVFWDGNVTDGTALFTYEPVYRLHSAIAREHAAGFAGPRTDVDIPVSPLPHANDTDKLIQYLESYQYDKVGNIEEIAHGPTGAPPAWRSPRHYVPGTNRLQETMVEGDEPDGPWHAQYAYDAHGNMTAMPHLARIDWDWKDQMQRADKGGGGAVYFTYDSSGERVRKVWEHGGTIDERIYLGGYEIYRQRKSGTVAIERQTLHVMDGVRRVAMVETKTVDTSVSSLVPTPVIRFQLGNHLDSAHLELDEDGRMISYEEYHPYGTSAYRAQNGDIEVSLKRYRYTGKERDEETSLYYYGARYYAAWLASWISADPGGTRDGTNLYCYVRGRPIHLVDPNGGSAWEAAKAFAAKKAEQAWEGAKEAGDAAVTFVADVGKGYIHKLGANEIGEMERGSRLGEETARFLGDEKGVALFQKDQEGDERAITLQLDAIPPTVGGTVGSKLADATPALAEGAEAMVSHQASGTRRAPPPQHEAPPEHHAPPPPKPAAAKPAAAKPAAAKPAAAKPAAAKPAAANPAAVAGGQAPPAGKPPASPPPPPAPPAAPTPPAPKPPKIDIGEIKSVNSRKAAATALNKFKYPYNIPDTGVEGIVLYDQQGNVFLIARESGGFETVLFDGKIGQVPASEMPTAAYGTHEFGNAIEGPVTRVVEQATGQKFIPKHPSATGPDLLPH